MGIPVLVIGQSGTGKSASLRNFPEDKYSLVEVEGKPLPFKSKKAFYNTDNASLILSYIQSQKAKDSIIIDDSQYIMANEYMRQAKTRGFDKFVDIGKAFWDLINAVKSLPDTKIVYFLHHMEPDTMGGWKVKTIGKMLDEKICIEGMFTIVLRSCVIDKTYSFSTKTDGTDPVKTPIGMFENSSIDNDLSIVDTTIRNYYDLNQDFQTLAFGHTAPQKQRQIPKELYNLLHSEENGNPVFTTDQKAMFLKMLDYSSEEWVIQQVKQGLCTTVNNRD